MTTLLRNPLKPLLLASLICTVFSTAALASPLEGIWLNTNPDTQSSPQIEIQANEDGTYRFFWWGKTHPENSKYGPFPLELYYRSPGDPQSAKSAMGVHETSFSDMVFTMELDADYLRVSMFTKFKDDSGRKPYRINMTFRKE